MQSHINTGLLDGLQQDKALQSMYLVLDQATAAQKLLKILFTERVWTNIGRAQDKNGKEVDPLSPVARRWSLVGAIHKAKLTRDEVIAVKALLETESLTVMEYSSQISYQELIKHLTIASEDADKKTKLVDDYCNLLLRRVVSYLQQQRVAHAAHRHSDDQQAHEGQ